MAKNYTLYQIGDTINVIIDGSDPLNNNEFRQIDIANDESLAKWRHLSATGTTTARSREYNVLAGSGISGGGGGGTKEVIVKTSFPSAAALFTLPTNFLDGDLEILTEGVNGGTPTTKTLTVPNVSNFDTIRGKKLRVIVGSTAVTLTVAFDTDYTLSPVGNPTVIAGEILNCEFNGFNSSGQKRVKISKSGAGSSASINSVNLSGALLSEDLKLKGQRFEEPTLTGTPNYETALSQIFALLELNDSIIFNVNDTTAVNLNVLLPIGQNKGIFKFSRIRQTSGVGLIIMEGEFVNDIVDGGTKYFNVFASTSFFTDWKINTPNNSITFATEEFRMISAKGLPDIQGWDVTGETATSKFTLVEKEIGGITRRVIEMFDDDGANPIARTVLTQAQWQRFYDFGFSYVINARNLPKVPDVDFGGVFDVGFLDADRPIGFVTVGARFRTIVNLDLDATNLIVIVNGVSHTFDGTGGIENILKNDVFKAEIVFGPNFVGQLFVNNIAVGSTITLILHTGGTATEVAVKSGSGGGTNRGVDILNYGLISHLESNVKIIESIDIDPFTIVDLTLPEGKRDYLIRWGTSIKEGKVNDRLRTFAQNIGGLFETEPVDEANIRVTIDGQIRFSRLITANTTIEGIAVTENRDYKSIITEEGVGIASNLSIANVDINDNTINGLLQNTQPFKIDLTPQQKIDIGLLLNETITATTLTDLQIIKLGEFIYNSITSIRAGQLLTQYNRISLCEQVLFNNILIETTGTIIDISSLGEGLKILPNGDRLQFGQANTFRFYLFVTMMDGQSENYNMQLFHRPSSTLIRETKFISVTNNKRIIISLDCEFPYDIDDELELIITAEGSNKTVDELEISLSIYN